VISENEEGRESSEKEVETKAHNTKNGRKKLGKMEKRL